MRENIQNLTEEIKKLALHEQAMYEVDLLFSDANEIVNDLKELDWEELKIELPKWNNIELKIFASILSCGDENGVIIDDNFFYGYIFTLVDYSTAAFLLNDMFYFFDNNSINSKELLESMLTKLSDLKKNDYLEDSEYDYWRKRIYETKAFS